MHDFIAGLPKCELHLHIEGTLEPELKFALAERNGLTLQHKTVEEMKASYDFDSLLSFLNIYYEAMNVLVKEPDFYDLAMAYLTKAASQNVRYVEMFFDPQAHTGRGVPFDYVIRGLTRAIDDAEKQFGIRAQLIMCFLRDYQAEFAMATLVQALPYKQWIAGVGLDSNEEGNPPAKFAAVYARAREEGFRTTMHCDVENPAWAPNIAAAVREIGVDRIDHGIRVLEDPELAEECRAKGIGFTVCPISNGFVRGDNGGPEIRKMLDLGLLVTINSDDPAYFGGYVGENVAQTQADLGLSKDEVVQLQRNAFEITWLPRAKKDELLAELEAYAGS
jgi:adenosine deaminase